MSAETSASQSASESTAAVKRQVWLIVDGVNAAESADRHGYGLENHLSGYGISIELIALVAEYAIPALIKCWLSNHQEKQPTSSPQRQLKDLAERNWISEDGRYRMQLLRWMRPETLRASIRANSRLGVHQLDAMSTAMLDRARQSSEQEVVELLTEVATIDLSTIPDPKVV